MESTSTPARRFWHAIEPIHAAVYFAPEPAEAARAIGLRGYWMGYFAGRVAPLGPVPPEVVAAMVYGFSPEMVARAIPDAWRFAEPSLVLETRINSAAVALRHHLTEPMVATFEELAGLLWRAVAGCSFDARPLGAAWAGVTRPRDPVAAVWLAATILREHRGDGHVIAAVSADLSGLDNTVTFIADGMTTREVMQPNRGWSDEEWGASYRRLRARGVVNNEGLLSEKGVTLRRGIEDLTDHLALAPVEHLGASSVERAISLAGPISRHLLNTGVFPVPNPIGVP